LRLAFEEVRQWRSFDVPRAIPCQARSLISRRLDTLQRPEEHGELLVSRSLGYLAAAHHGLAEEELIEVLAEDDAYWQTFLRSSRHAVPEGARRLPDVIWARLRADLEPYLTVRQSENHRLLGFYHRIFQETVIERIHASRLSLSELRVRLGDHFRTQGPFDVRARHEAPWLFMAAGDSGRLLRLLTSRPWLDKLEREPDFLPCIRWLSVQEDYTSALRATVPEWNLTSEYLFFLDRLAHELATSMTRHGYQSGCFLFDEALRIAIENSLDPRPYAEHLAYFHYKWGNIGAANATRDRYFS
jgi:hypothetical protein